MRRRATRRAYAATNGRAGMRVRVSLAVALLSHGKCCNYGIIVDRANYDNDLQESERQSFDCIASESRYRSRIVGRCAMPRIAITLGLCAALVLCHRRREAKSKLSPARS